MREFSKLPAEKQDKLRTEYKNKYEKEYQYSINLFILYTILGILSVIGILLLPLDAEFGYLVFIICFIFMLIVLYFLNLSNQPFKKFLKKKGYK